MQFLQSVSFASRLTFILHSHPPVSTPRRRREVCKWNNIKTVRQFIYRRLPCVPADRKPSMDPCCWCWKSFRGRFTNQQKSMSSTQFISFMFHNSTGYQISFFDLGFPVCASNSFLEKCLRPTNTKIELPSRHEIFVWYMNQK